MADASGRSQRWSNLGVATHKSIRICTRRALLSASASISLPCTAVASSPSAITRASWMEAATVCRPAGASAPAGTAISNDVPSTRRLSAATPGEQTTSTEPCAAIGKASAGSMRGPGPRPRRGGLGLHGAFP
eukprot:3200321-Prymnesium_polylepis.2